MPTQATQEGQDGRRLRSGYRDLHAQALRDGEDLVSLEKTTLAELLAKANELQERVQRPREQAVDSEVFAHLTDRGVELAKKLAHGGKGHTAKDFLRRLKALHVHTSQAQDDGASDPRTFSWADLGSHVTYMFRPAPGVFCMVGPLDAQPKLRKAPVRHAKQELGKLVRPDELTDLQETEKQETDRNMDEVWEVLCREGSVPLLELVLNHDSFAQTVENVFAVSFLVKDGRVSLTKSEKGVMVNKVSMQVDDTAARKDTERMQFVISLTMDAWEEWKQYCDRKDFRMKHRAPRDHSRPAPQPSPTEEAEGGAGASGSAADALGSGGDSARSGRRDKGKTRARDPDISADEDEQSEDEEPAVATKSRTKRRR